MSKVTKIFKYKSYLEDTILLLLQDNEIWTSASQIEKLFGINTKSLKSTMKNIKARSHNTIDLQSMDVLSSSIPEFNEASKKVLLYNSNWILAIGFQTNELATNHFFKWFSRTMLKYTGKSPEKPDAEMTGRGRIYIQFGDMSESIFNTDMYFKNIYLNEWFQDPFVADMIKDIDKATVLGDGLIDSYVLGKIPPTDLSGGVKTLILIYKECDKVFNVSACGDNCAKWILRIAKRKNITINLNHIMDFGKKSFDIFILNNNKHVTNMADLVSYAGYFL